MIRGGGPGHRGADYIEKPIRDVEAFAFRNPFARFPRRDEQLARAQASLRVDQDRRGEKGRVAVSRWKPAAPSHCRVLGPRVQT